MSEIIQYEQPVCAFCKGNDADLVAENINGVYDFGTITKEISYKEKFHFVECNICGLRYFTPRYTDRYMNEVCKVHGDTPEAKKRAELYFNTGSFTGIPAEGYTIEKQKQFLYDYYTGHIHYLKLLLGRPIESIFEIGCSVGYTLTAAKNYKINFIKGCDPDYHSVRISKELGFDVENCMFADYQSDMLYDVILSYNCIEHTYTPFEDIKKAYSMLDPGGLFLIHTFFEELDTEKKMFAPCGHIYHFFSYVLREMLESAGFKIIHFQKSGAIGYFACQK